MKSRTAKIARGRPRSPVAGARAAFDFVETYRLSRKLSYNALAIEFCMTPSTVFRTLTNRTNASWTPGLTNLYRIAQMRSANPSDTSFQQLATYSGPGEAVVKRLLRDVEELIVVLARTAS
jgi:hypothetical protein